MKSEICEYDYFERINRNLKIVEDDYGNIRINDYAELYEKPFSEGLKYKAFGSRRKKLTCVSQSQRAKTLNPCA